MASSPAFITEPLPRYYHFAAATDRTVFIYGGEVDGEELPTDLNVFDFCNEVWRLETTTGQHPPSGLYDGCSAVAHHDIYLYGGRYHHDGPHEKYNNSLYKYEPSSHQWLKILPVESAQCPIPKEGFGMVFWSNFLIIFGGRGDKPIGPAQAGAKYANFGVGDVITNELHFWDLKEGTWSSPIVTGARPPFCFGFTLTMVEKDKAVLFGGYGQRYLKDVYTLDFKRMHWTKLNDVRGDSWPKGRYGHAAVCLGFGGDHPELLITGGSDGWRTLNDAWILDIKSWRWREVKSLSIQRFGHSTTGFTINQKITEVVVFGGRVGPRFLTHTIVLRFECQECPSSDVSPTREWVLTDKAEGHQLGTEQRVREKGVLLGIPSLEKQSIAVIVSSLLQQKLKPDELDARLSDYVPGILRNAIIDKLKLHTLPLHFQ